MRIPLAFKRAGSRPPRKAPFRRRGFALVEILIASCMLGLAVVALGSAYSFGFSLIRLSKESVRAGQILVQKLETIRVYPWSQTDPGSGIIPPTFLEHFSTGPAAGGAVYNGTITITDAPVSESYSNALRQVTVSLNWMSGGVLHSRSMTTFIAQNGIQAL